MRDLLEGDADVDTGSPEKPRCGEDVDGRPDGCGRQHLGGRMILETPWWAVVLFVAVLVLWPRLAVLERRLERRALRALADLSRRGAGHGGLGEVVRELANDEGRPVRASAVVGALAGLAARGLVEEVSACGSVTRPARVEPHGRYRPTSRGRRVAGVSAGRTGRRRLSW